MASPGDHGAAARNRKHLRVLLPFTCDTLRIPDELAREIGSGEALIIVPHGRGVVQRVEVGRDGGGAFLGRGWQDFADACGVGAGWFLLLRHQGGGVLTVKAFDGSCCLRELLGAPPAAMSGTDASCRPQFISVLSPDFMEKMLIPANFVQNHIPRGHLNNHIAALFGPLGRNCEIELKMSQSDMFFAGGWPQFLALNGITEANHLLLRYEGNMMFKVKVFGPNGCQRESTYNDIGMQKISSLPNKEKQQEVPCGEEQERLVRYPASIQKCKRKNDWPSSEGQEKPKDYMNSSSMAPRWKRSFYEIGPPSWIKKVINTSIHTKQLPLATAFCNAIGLREPCMITLKTSLGSPGSWQVHSRPYKNASYMLVQGWSRFYLENSLKEGDMCAFNVVEPTLWHVVITRFKQETTSVINMKCKSRSDLSSSAKQKGPKGPMTFLNKVSSNRRCVFRIGPPAWIRKEINISTIKHIFSLPLVFCEGIGLRETCVITLKTSVSSNNAWHARVVSYKNCYHLGGLGWKRFCQENGIKEGDVCTFDVVETKLWNVAITRCTEKTDQFCNQETPNRRKNYSVSSEGQTRPKFSMISLNKASYRNHSSFDIGPPAWIEKEINTSTIESHLSLPLSFCEALGLREVCTVTLKTSASSTSSWQVQVVPYSNRNQVGGLGWKRFCSENRIKVGDICTIRIIEATFWHVTIVRG